MAIKYVSGRVKELKVGITNYSESKDTLTVVGNANVGGIVTAASFVGGTGVSTYNGDLDIESSVLITGITTIGGLVDINAGGQANTFKVEDLTDNRVVIAGSGGELEDDANLTFNGTQFNVGSAITMYQATGIISATKYYGDGAALTGISVDATALKDANGNVKAQANPNGVVFTGIITGNGSGLTNLDIPGISTSGESTFTRLSVSGVSTFGGLIDANGGITATTGTFEDLGGANRIVFSATSGSGGRLDDSPNLSYVIGTNTLNVVNIECSGHAELDDVNVSGVSTLTTVDINAGHIDNTVIGATVQAAGSFANLVATNGTFTGYVALSQGLNVTGVSTFAGNINANGNIVGDNSTNITGIAGVTATTLAGTLQTAAQTNVTSLGTLSAVTVSGNITANGNIVGDNSTNITGIAGVTASTLTGTLQTAAQPNVTSLGTIASLTASTAKVSDLTNTRVVYAGAAGELQDSANLTFNGTTLTAGAFAGDGSQLTNLPGIDTAGGSTFNNVFSSGINTLGKGTNGVTYLYHADVLKFQTTGLGVTVYGTTQTQQLNVSGLSTFTNSVLVNGGAGLLIGDANASLYRAADNLRIDVAGNHDFYVRTNSGGGTGGNIHLQAKLGENSIVANSDGSVDLYHDNLVRLKTTGIGITVAGVGNTAYITGPDEIWIDPSPMGVGTTSGVVRIRGDLYVDGKEVIIDVEKLEIGDFQIGIASTAGTNAQLDGAGIGIGSVSIRKTITWNNATSALMCSENWNLGSGKHYEIAGTDVLTATTLGSGVVNSSLTSLGTIASLTASTAKVSDLTNTRVVYAGASGELQDSANLTFNGTTLTANAFAGNGSALTNVAVTGINTGAGSDFTDLTVNGNLKVTGVSTFTGNIDANGDIDLPDAKAINFGDSRDLGIGHTSHNGYIWNQNNSLTISSQDHVRIKTRNLTSNNPISGGDKAIECLQGGTVELYGANAKKLETTSSGVIITGTCQATDFNSTSDIRLKTNIQAIEDPLAKLVQIEGVSFNWKENNKPALGVIADQVQEILPELVTDGDPKTVNYNGLIGLLIEAVKEQQIQINELKSKLP